MASLDAVSIAILLGAVLVMAGILSSLLALRFGAPLLLVFLFIGMLAGDSGPGSCGFNDVRTTYLVGSVALALILFDGGLRTRFQSIRAVLAPSMMLATVGVLVTALITAPVAKYALDLNWPEALLVGRRGGVDRRRGGVSAGPRAGLAAAPARRRDAGGRIRHQRSVRRVSDAGAGRIHVDRRKLGLADRTAICPRGRARRHHRRGRRPSGGAGAEPGGAAAGPARALCRHRGAGDLRHRANLARVGISRGLSRRHHHRQPADPRAQFRRDLSRRRDLAGADRDVRAARPAGLAAAACRQHSVRPWSWRWC